MSNWTAISQLATAAQQRVFGETVFYQPAASGEAVTVIGIADRASDEQMQANGVYLRLFVHLGDFAVAPEQGDEVTMDRIVYRVFEVRVDTGGGAWLSLRAVG